MKGNKSPFMNIKLVGFSLKAMKWHCCVRRTNVDCGEEAEGPETYSENSNIHPLCTNFCFSAKNVGTDEILLFKMPFPFLANRLKRYQREMRHGDVIFVKTDFVEVFTREAHPGLNISYVLGQHWQRDGHLQFSGIFSYFWPESRLYIYMVNLAGSFGR